MAGIARTILTADVVYNGMGTARADGAVVVQEAQGRTTIADVLDRAEALAAYPGGEVRDAGFAISPAPVNAHTHLDLSTMPLVDDAYERFIPTVIAFAGSGGRTLAAAEAGADEVLGSGVSVIGDIVTRPDVMRWLLQHERLAGVAYWEVIGPNPLDAPAKLAETEALLREFMALERPGGVRVGLTPHTPHTVSGELLAALVRLAQGLGIPVQIHVEESPLEKAMHVHGTGELAAWRRSEDPGWQPPGMPAIALLESLGVLAAAPTLVHMVNVTEDEIRTVQRYGVNVVHCPRSNGLLRCGRFPWETYARHGVNVAIGTDSRGSSPSLAVQEEVAHALELHGAAASPPALVRAAVKGGYRTLGLKPPVFRRGDDAGILAFWPRIAG